MSSTRDGSGDAEGGKPAAEAPAARAPGLAARTSRAAAPTPAATAEPGRGSRLLRSAAKKLPFRWLTIALGGVALVATAGFGGLGTVEEPEPVELAAGDEFRGALAAITLERAVLIDDFGEGGAWPGEGQRALVVVMQAENVWTTWTGTGTALLPFVKTFELVGMPDVSVEAIARFDDATLSPVLQPGVPVELAMSYLVPEDALAAGDELRIALYDQTVSRGQNVTSGDYWTLDAEPSAFMTLEVGDVGAGADEEPS